MRPTSIILGRVVRPRLNTALVDEFGVPKSKPKAWAGQDKDKFFRDKYAHVHAKQLKRRQEEQAAKRAKPQAKDSSRKLPQINPRYADKVAASLKADPRLEYVYGKGPVTAALETRTVRNLFSSHTYADIDADLLARCADKKVVVKAGVPAQHLNILSGNGVHNRYVAAVTKREHPSVTAVEVEYGQASQFTVGEATYPVLEGRRFPLGVFIDEVTDTHNMGAIMRSAYWLGADFVAFSNRNCAPMSPAVLKASAGAAEYLPVFQAPHPLRLFEQLAETGWAVIASTPRPHRDAVNLGPEQLAHILKQQPCLLVVGSEGDGLRMSLLQRSTHNVTIKSAHHSPAVDSLNVSVATAVLLAAFRS